MREITQKIYTLNELTESIQKKVLDKYRYINVDGGTEWYDYIFEAFKEDTKLKGFDNIHCYFSGFGSQGDGASFTADVNISTYLKYYEGLVIVPNLLKDIANGAEPSISIKKRGSYEHEYTMYTDSETGGLEDKGLEEFNKLGEGIIDVCQNLARDLYSLLGKEYDYLISNEAVAETITLNDMEFYENGGVYNG